MIFLKAKQSLRKQISATFGLNNNSDCQHKLDVYFSCKNFNESTLIIDRFILVKAVEGLLSFQIQSTVDPSMADFV